MGKVGYLFRILNENNNSVRSLLMRIGMTRPKTKKMSSSGKKTGMMVTWTITSAQT